MGGSNRTTPTKPGCVANAKTMVAAGRQGSIINIASGAALRGSPRGVHYVASKGGVLSLTRAMALELAPHRIRVNAIAPGLTDTAQPRYGSSEAEIAEMARAIPLGRMAQPDEIARAAVFLASENAGFVTGQTLHVNGGSCDPGPKSPKSRHNSGDPGNVDW